MASNKTKTLNLVKDKIQVSEQAKQRRKTYSAMKKQLLAALEEGPMTVPELAKATQLPINEVTYYLMTLRKYGDVKTGEIDDDDEFFYYELKKQQNHGED
jgi:predicted Rossmann fold nucleotide-binding protein DprA/Smf involved in DNA uptake